MVHLWNYDDQEDPAGSTAIFPDHLAGRVVATNALVNLFARRTQRRRCPLRGRPGRDGRRRPRGSAREGRPGARLGRAAGQPQRARGALGRLPLRRRTAVVCDQRARRCRVARASHRPRRPGMGARCEPGHRRGTARCAGHPRRPGLGLDPRARQARAERTAPVSRRPRPVRCSRASIRSRTPTTRNAASCAGSISRSWDGWPSKARRFHASGMGEIAEWQAPLSGEHTREIARRARPERRRDRAPPRARRPRGAFRLSGR